MEKSNKKHKFNVIDALLLILILAIIGAAVFFLIISSGVLSSDDGGEGVNMIEYEVEFRTVRNEFSDIVLERWKVGDTVTDGDTGEVIGELVGVRAENASFIGNDMSDIEGKLVASDYPNHSNIVMVIKAEAGVDEYGRYVLGEEIDLSVGSSVRARLPYFTYTGYCTRVQELTENAETEAE